RVPYEPGELVATALTARGEELGRTVLQSAVDARVQLVPESDTVRPGELVFVDVLIADEAGVVEHHDDRLLHASALGGELLAFGSARPRTEERYDTGVHTTYFGHAQAVLRMGTQDLTLVVDDGGHERRVTIVCDGTATKPQTDKLQQ
ncbi:MAG: hypothetical protein J6D34_03470, partial [Atopobiaceae bacterium]|nr:hypothetical protein [Atopobiaceae bacterium]